MAGLKGTDFRHYSSPEDVFGAFGDIFGDLFGFGGARQAWHRGSDLRYQIDLEFVEAARGVKKEIELERPAVCSHCQGSGAESPEDVETCSTCRGQGQVLRQRGFLTISTACPACRGEGRADQKALQSLPGARADAREEDRRGRDPGRGRGGQRPAGARRGDAEPDARGGRRGIC